MDRPRHAQIKHTRHLVVWLTTSARAKRTGCGRRFLYFASPCAHLNERAITKCECSIAAPLNDCSDHALCVTTISFSQPAAVASVSRRPFVASPSTAPSASIPKQHWLLVFFYCRSKCLSS
uniref:Uncharacterized protein n=1 Tax=Plectus sambesii TaxID=2011161 RepID=A0A914VZ78_9BILA